MGTTIRIENRLRECRERRGLKQIELARKAGVSISTVSRVERWGFPVTKSTAQRLAAVLGVKVGEVFPDSKVQVIA